MDFKNLLGLLKFSFVILAFLTLVHVLGIWKFLHTARLSSQETTRSLPAPTTRGLSAEVFGEKQQREVPSPSPPPSATQNLTTPPWGNNVSRTAAALAASRNAEGKEGRIRTSHGAFSPPAITSTPTPTSTMTAGSRPLECRNCFTRGYKRVIDNWGLCAVKKGSGVVVELLVLVTTTADHVENRRALRSTWLARARGNSASSNVRYLFMLGETFNRTARQALIRENQTYGDLLMEDFQDTYRNLTLKTMMGMDWAVTSCPHARYVMKTDDDMWVNLKSILQIIKNHREELETALAGACRGRGFPLRKENSKWSTSVEEYPQSTFPAYCSGTCYLTSMSVIKKIHAVSPSVPFFYLEDIYVGLCLRKLKLSVKKLEGFHHRATDHDPCFLQSAKVITSHEVPPKVLVKAWNTSCANSTIY